jgi:hypothetical protein
VLGRCWSLEGRMVRRRHRNRRRRREVHRSMNRGADRRNRRVIRTRSRRDRRLAA